jgi:hypothetical protein
MTLPPPSDIVVDHPVQFIQRYLTDECTDDWGNLARTQDYIYISGRKTADAL